MYLGGELSERWHVCNVLRFVCLCRREGQMASASTAGRRCSTLNW